VRTFHAAVAAADEQGGDGASENRGTWSVGH
jgi:hypothetical protein